jgi:hypothetical protein
MSCDLPVTLTRSREMRVDLHIDAPRARARRTCLTASSASRSWLAIVVTVLSQIAACGEPAIDTARSDTQSMDNAQKAVGAHSIVFQRINGGLELIETPALETAPSGSTFIVGVGRGKAAEFSPPVDNINQQQYRQVGTTRRYTNWPNSGTALYALEGATGGSDFRVSTTTPPSDEVTLAVVEVPGSRVEGYAWNEVLYPKSFWRLRRLLLSKNSVTSASVETAGPATLVAFWWGDAGVDGEKTAVPNNGFKVIESVLEPGGLVQCAVAVRRVEQAGQYDVTWTSSPLQGAQLWLVAVGEGD